MCFSKARHYCGIDDHRIIDNQIRNEIAYQFPVIKNRKWALHRNDVSPIPQFNSQCAFVQFFVEPRLQLVKHFHRGTDYRMG